MSDEAIARGRRRDKIRKQKYYDQQSELPARHRETPPLPSPHQSLLQKLQVWWKRLLP
ncbi:hypothetical protein [Rhizobacter sp. P5_C2]